MPIFFNNKTNLSFTYEKTIPCSILNKLNIFALQLYGLYRNTVYDSYKPKEDLAKDIKEFKQQYVETKNSKLISNPLYQDPVYHYAVAASIGAISEWKDSNENMQAYIAYQTVNGHQKKVGFVHFTEKSMNGKSVVYIAQAGVTHRGQGIGKCLMECVLSHYPAETEFYILTLTFNTEAKALYQDALKFVPIQQSEVAQFGLDERYCGFKQTTSKEQILAIKNKQSNQPPAITTQSFSEHKDENNYYAVRQGM